MIKMTKDVEPTILFDNSKKWTLLLLGQINKNKKPEASLATKYRHKKIKEALIAETHGKCVYCESKLLHIHHGDVEHIFPKSIYANKTFEWSNLTLACEICNQNKSNSDPNLTLIVNPYNEDPKEHIAFAGPFAFTVTQKGSDTDTLIGLNRPALFERRNERMSGISNILKNILDMSKPAVVRKRIYDDFVKNEISPSSEYSAMVRSFFEVFKKSLPQDIL